MRFTKMRFAPHVAGLLMFVLVGVAGLVAVDVAEQGRRASLEGLVTSETTAVRAALEDELRSTISLAQGLRSFLAAVPEVAEPSHPLADRVAPVLQGIYADGEHLRNIGVAPDNQIRYVHPLEGNEAALGLRYEDVPAQLADVERAIRSRQSVLAGPVDLVQGGRGLINRTPVFLPDGSYWGITSLVIDADSLFDEVAATASADDIDWAVVTRGGQDASLVAGDSLPTADDTPTARIAVDLPGTAWEVVGWPEGSVQSTGPPVGQRALVLLVAVLVGGLVAVVLSQRRQAQLLSIHDPLTGLPNRRLLDDRIAHLVASSLRSGDTWTLLSIDLDGFKPVNDVHGHATGDSVLCAIADRLSHATRPADTVARVGGDEFVVLLPDARDETTAHTVAARLREELRRPILVDGVEVVVDASIGVAAYPADGTAPEQLLAAADAAMYGAKAEQRPPTEPADR